MAKRVNSTVRRVARAAATVLASLIVVILAGVGFLYYQGNRSPLGNSQYVALGSSFAAGPGVGTRAPDSPILCIRSSQNYANLLAQARNLNLTDVTCSGATAQNVLYGGQYFQPPQLNALRSSTELVTITVGGNDVSYLGNLFAWSCQHDPTKVPFLDRPLYCHPTSDAQVDHELSLLPLSLKQIAIQVKERSPHAVLVFVDYATILPDTGACPDRLPITDAQMQRARYVAKALEDITASVAQDTGAILVQASKITHGHDICSADPWVFGFKISGVLGTFGPTPYHPTTKAMQAIADAIHQAVHPIPVP